MAPKSETPPDITYLEAMRTVVQNDFREDDTQIDRMRQVRSLRMPVPLDPAYRLNTVEVRDPTIADEVQRVSATLGLNPPRLTVDPARAGDTGEQNAVLREHWTEEVLKVAGRKEYHGGTDTFSAVVDSVVGDGGAWTKLVFANDTWQARYGLKRERYEDTAKQTAADVAYSIQADAAKKAAGPPFVFTAIDVRTVYPIWAAGELQEVFEISEHLAAPYLRQKRLSLTPDGEIVPEGFGPSVNWLYQVWLGRKITTIEHWTPVWASYAVVNPSSTGSGRFVKQFKHRYGRVPYFYAPGYTFNFSRHSKVGWGVGEAMRWLCEYHSYLMTIYAQTAQRDALPPLFRELPDEAPPNWGDDGKVPAGEMWKPREIINGKPGEKLVPIVFPGVGQALKEHITQIEGHIKDLTSPHVQSQIGSGMEGAGFAINQVLAEAKTTQNPLAQHIERMLEEVTRFLWKLARDRVGETIWVRPGEAGGGWLKADPETDLTDDVGIKWELDPERPSAQLIEERYWGERLHQGTASLDQAIEAMGDDPEEVRMGREMDELRASPQYKAYLLELVFQQAGRGDLLGKAAQAQLAAGQGEIPGQPSAPPGGMGNAQVPDMGQLALGGGANPSAPPTPVAGGGNPAAPLEMPPPPGATPGGPISPGTGSPSPATPMPIPGGATPLNPTLAHMPVPPGMLDIARMLHKKPPPEPVGAGSVGAAGPMPSGVPGAELGGP